MKIIKYPAIFIGLYFIFTIIVFVSINSPKEGAWYKITPGSRKTSIKLNNFFPELNYQVYIFLNKKNNYLFRVDDESHNQLYETRTLHTPGEAIKIANITNITKTKYYFSEDLPLTGNKIEDKINLPKEKTTMVRTLIARLIKNWHTYVFTNQLLISSFIKYLAKDIPFKIFYIIMIFIILWYLIKTGKDLTL